MSRCAGDGKGPTLIASPCAPGLPALRRVAHRSRDMPTRRARNFLATLTSAPESSPGADPAAPPPVSVPARHRRQCGGTGGPARRLGRAGAPAPDTACPPARSTCSAALARKSTTPASDHAVEYVYHEKQLSALCGVHTLNNLCQGPQFGAGDLAELALSLDAREVELSHVAPAATSTAPPRRSTATSTGGDFSVEVLKAALAQLGCRLVERRARVELVERLAEARGGGGLADA